MNWKNIHLVDGWTIRRDESGYTLTAQVYAKNIGDLPTRGDAVPTGDLACAVPAFAKFGKYLISEAEITPLTSVGPWLASLTARPHLSASGKNSDSLLSQNSVSATYQDFHIKPRWCRVREAGEESGWARISGASHWISDFKDDKTGSKWSSDPLSVPAGCPFARRPHPKHADENLRFLAVTVKYNRLEGSGIEDWANFHGIVPVHSMPSWIKIPHGDDRWRLWDETYEMAKDTDGRRILSITRILLGIPSGFVDTSGSRCKWNQNLLGQKNWGDLV